MVNIMNLVKVRNKVQKNGFDLSRKNGFTAKAGEILPFLTLHTLPNSEYEINVNSFTRTMPLNTPAFVRIKEYYDFYFVPYRLLYRYAPQMFAQTNEQNFATGAKQQNFVGIEFPYFDSRDLNSYAFHIDPVRLDILGYKFTEKFCKLAEYLGYGDLNEYDKTHNAIQYALNPFPFLAYQKIYMDYFRNSQWESVEPRSFNIDYIAPGTPLNETSWLSIEDFAKCMQLRYCNYPADMFTGLLPNTQYGDVSTVNCSVAAGGKESWFDYDFYISKDGDLMGSENYPNGSNYVYTENGKLGTGPYGSADLSKKANVIKLNGASLGGSAYFNILELRKAEAKQRYSEVAQTWDKDYPSQMAAHFNANTPSALGMRCKYLGGSDNVIQIGDVMNTNLFGGQESTDKFNVGQAEMKGKGTGVNNGKIRFKCEEHGIIMGVYHALPLLDYTPLGVDEFNFKTEVTDYAIPEFDSIGMQPVFGRGLLFSSRADVFSSQIIGYAPRYVEYKTAIDTVHGAFYNGGLSSWYTALFTTKFIESLLLGNAVNSYDLQRVNPNIFNSIFVAQADSNVNTDNLLVNCFLDIKAVLPLDRNGLPY